MNIVVDSYFYVLFLLFFGQMQSNTGVYPRTEPILNSITQLKGGNVTSVHSSISFTQFHPNSLLFLCQYLSKDETERRKFINALFIWTHVGL